MADIIVIYNGYGYNICHKNKVGKLISELN